MANTRSSGGSRHRDAFRAEVSSLLADLGELAAEPAARPAPPPAGSGAETKAEAAPAIEAAPVAAPPPVAEAAPVAGPPPVAEAAPVASPLPASTEPHDATPVEVDWPVTNQAPVEVAVPPAEGAEVPGTQPPIEAATGWAATPEPPGPPAPAGLESLPAAAQVDRGLAAPEAYPPPPSVPPGAAEPIGTVELEDLPSFSPSYLPPLPPALSAGTPQPDRWVSPFDPEPPPPPPDWPLMEYQPSFERLIAAEPAEPTVPSVWPSVPISGPEEEARTGSAGHRHPVPLPTAWPSPSEPSGAEVAPNIGGAEGAGFSGGMGSLASGAAASFANGEAAAGFGDEEAGATVTGETHHETAQPGALAADDAAPGAMDTAPEQPQAGLGNSPGWSERPSPAAAPSSGPPVLPGWVLRTPRPSGAERTPLAPASQAGRGWEVRESPSVGLTPSGEPLDLTAAGWDTETQGDLPAAAGPPIGEVESGVAPEGLPDDPAAAPPQPAATPSSQGGTAFSLASATGGPPVIAERPILPLIPGGQPAPVSTKAWSLAAAMESLEPLTPPPPRSAAASPAEPPAAMIVPAQPAGGNPPFPVMVTVLILILVVIVVLIVMHLHS